MMRTLRSNYLFSIVGSLTILLFGGRSGMIVGGLLGALVGFLSDARSNARSSLQAGAILGCWLVVANLGLFFLEPLASGQEALIVAALSFGIATLAAGLMGKVRQLPEKLRSRYLISILIIALVLFPWIDQLAQTNWIAAVIQSQIFVILALGLNVTVGYAGLLDLGYAAFFAIGAYTTGLLSSPQLGLHLNFWMVIWSAAACAGIAGVILGLPVLRLRGDYLAIVTLGFGEIMPIIFRNLTEVRLEEPISKLIATIAQRPEFAICLLGCDRALNLTGGEAGINPIDRPSLPILGTFDPSDYLPWYYLILAIVLATVGLLSRLQDSQLGRAWAAIREDELAAECMGIHLASTKLLAFGVSATVAGFAGAFYATYISAIFPSVFGFSLSIIILCMVILGGLGSIRGVIVGGTLITLIDQLYLPQFAQRIQQFLNAIVLPNINNSQWRDLLTNSLDPNQMRLFLFGLILLVMMRIRPEGLLPDRFHAEESSNPET